MRRKARCNTCGYEGEVFDSSHCHRRIGFTEDYDLIGYLWHPTDEHKWSAQGDWVGGHIGWAGLAKTGHAARGQYGVIGNDKIVHHGVLTTMTWIDGKLESKPKSKEPMNEYDRQVAFFFDERSPNDGSWGKAK